MIVKVQLSLMTTLEETQVLIYNRERTVEYTGDASAEVLRLMGQRVRAFFHARLVDGVIHLDGETRERSW